MKTTILISIVLTGFSVLAAIPPTRAAVQARQGIKTAPELVPGTVNAVSMAGRADRPQQSARDLQLNARVQQELSSSFRNYNSENYSVFSQNGTVTIQGRVRTQKMADDVVKKIKTIKGVSRVESNLILDPSL